MDTEKAYLSNDKDMIQFRYGDKIIRFRGPYSLERFISIKEWDNGYIVVMAKYQHNAEPEEEYIDMILNGYAFTREENRIRILNLNNPEKALVISEDGTVLETTMDDIEICIVTDYWKSDREFMEDGDA